MLSSCEYKCKDGYIYDDTKKTCVSKLKPVDGVCRDGLYGQCIAGESDTKNQPAGVWKCLGLNG